MTGAHKFKDKQFFLPILIFSLVFLIAFTLRIFHLDTIPQSIDPDGADNIRGYLILLIDERSFFSLNWNGAPSINNYILGIGWELLGRSVAGIRFSTAFISSITIGFFAILSFVITKKIVLTILISILLSTNVLFLNFSRSAWENIFNAFFVLCICYAAWLLEKGRKITTAISILFIAGSVGGMYGYHPGKFFIVIVGIILIIHTISNLDKIQISKSFLIILISLVLILPQLLVFRSDQVRALDRIKTVSVFSQESPRYYLSQNIKNLGDAFLLFHPSAFDRENNYNSRYLPHGISFIDLTLLPFFLIGLVFSFFSAPFFILILVFTSLPSTLFSTGAPDGARIVHSIPIFYLFILMGFNQIIERSKQYKCVNMCIILFLFFLAAYISMKEVQTYFSWIEDKATLRSREPSIHIDEYSRWLSVLDRKLPELKESLTVSIWKDL